MMSILSSVPASRWWRLFPIETYLNLTGKRKEFFKLYDSLQGTADRSSSVDDDLAEALAAARR